MINTQLKVFVHVADCGSFSKAAEKLFISPAAIMKQMNLLEEQIGVHLLIRTNHGTHLTDAGKSFYKDAKLLMKHSEEAIQRARQLAQRDQYVIRVGTSLLNPVNVLIDLWNQVNDIYPQFKMKIVPFEDDSATLPTTYRSIGKDFDFIIGPYDQANWKEFFSVFQLGKYHVCFAVSRKHRLVSKTQLEMTDLYGERLMMVKRGNSPLIDQIRDYLTKEHPKIQIEDTPHHYGIDVFNRCEQSGAVLLTLDGWKDIHPSLVTIPANWNYTMPYGLLYPLNPSEGVKKFLEAVKEIQFV